jgi:hypothetical protein
LNELVDKYGQQWSKWTPILNWPTDIQLKHQFKKLERRRAKRISNWTIKEIKQCQNIRKRESIAQQNGNCPMN